MNEVTKLYENANIKPEYRYDCNLADTIKPVEVFPLHRCSKGEIKDYCTNKQDYRYCKVYKVNKIYPPFTAEKQIEILQFCLKWGQVHILQGIDKEYRIENSCYRHGYQPTLADAIANYINEKWEKLTPEERKQIKEILK